MINSLFFYTQDSNPYFIAIIELICQNEKYGVCKYNFRRFISVSKDISLEFKIDHAATATKYDKKYMGV